MDWLDLLSILLIPVAWFAPVGVAFVFGAAYLQALKSHAFAMRMIHWLAGLILLMIAIWIAPHVGTL